MMPPKFKIKGRFCKDRISELPDDLLVHVLCLLPTEQAVTTMFLSKRWRFVWTMIPKLDYIDTRIPKKNFWNFLNNSMRLHKAPSLERLCIKLYHDYTVDLDVGNWVKYATNHQVRELNLGFSQTLPACLYTCKTLVKLTLSYNVTVDVPSLPSLPSLQTLKLHCVTYKNQDSHVKLLSSCPVLKDLDVWRAGPDNVTSFIVKVPSLEKLRYLNVIDDGRGSLFIDTPGLNHLDIYTPHEYDNFLTSFSSVISLYLPLTKVAVACCSASNFSRLIELKLSSVYSVSNTLEAVMLLLHNAPQLKVLMMTHSCFDFTLSWNQPSSVPQCLLSHLEIFEWNSYEGKREENEMVAYILANSNCLKMVGICPQSDYNVEKKQKIKDELKSMYRVSSSSQLLFTAQMRWRYRK